MNDSENVTDIHAQAAEFLNEIFERYGIMITQISASWMDNSTISEIRMSVAETSIASRRKHL